jgi:hypothetical protein
MKAGDDFSSSKRNAAHAPKEARTAQKRLPGRLVGIIAVRPKGLRSAEYNPLIIRFVVNRYRKDLNKVIDQTNKTSRLPNYEQSLFESCFKNW